MKAPLVLSSFLFAATVQAADLKCPDYYPDAATTLTAIPAGREGSGIVRGAKLSSAYLTTGDLHKDPNGFDAMQLVPTKVKGGWDTETRFTPNEANWLVCLYGGDGRSSIANPQSAGRIEWWEKINPSIHDCALHFREVKLPSSTSSDWTATATCK